MNFQPTHRILCTAPALIGGIWPIVEPLLDQTYAAVDELTPPDLRDWLERGAGLLWVITLGESIVAVVTTSLVRKRSGLACRLVGCAGLGLPLWKFCIAEIEAYARAEGCVKVFAEGRRGWERALAGHGYATTRVILEKTL